MLNDINYWWTGIKHVRQPDGTIVAHYRFSAVMRVRIAILNMAIALTSGGKAKP